jgi:hypothetical protein
MLAKRNWFAMPNFLATLVKARLQNEQKLATTKLVGYAKYIGTADKSKIEK